MLDYLSIEEGLEIKKFERIDSVTVLRGYLGSGKTTLFEPRISQSGSIECCCYCKYMSEVNIDATLVKQGGFRKRKRSWQSLVILTI